MEFVIGTVSIILSLNEFISLHGVGSIYPTVVL